MILRGTLTEGRSRILTTGGEAVMNHEWQKIKVKQSRLEAIPAVELDIEAAFDWYERENYGPGVEFVNQLSAAYERILDHPLDIKDCVRVSAARSPDNSLTLFTLKSKRCDYRRRSAHAVRDPAEWQHRI